MSSFTEDLEVKLIGGEGVLLKEFTYYEKFGGIKITVPKGFKTDFATVPPLFQVFFPVIGRYNKAAILHDYLYESDSIPSLKRKKADKIFLNAMKILRVGFIRRNLMYLAVRLFGGRGFHD